MISVRAEAPTARAVACQHGIACALLLVDAALRPLLKAEKLLTRLPHARAQEVRPAWRPEALPVQQALISGGSSFKPRAPRRGVFYALDPSPSEISDDPARLDRTAIHAALAASYWRRASPGKSWTGPWRIPLCLGFTRARTRSDSPAQ